MVRARRGFPTALTAVIVVALLVAAPAAAQVISNPVRGNFEHTFMVNGRVVNEDGWPVNQIRLNVQITDLKGIGSSEPLAVETNCNGDFGAVFRLGTIEGRPRVRVAIAATGNEGITPVSSTQDLDKFHRRNDFVLVVPDEWEYSCGQARSYWPGRVTVWGRAVEGVGEHEANGTTLESTPVKYWPVNMTVTTAGQTWPPDSLQPTDERGDFKYSWTFQENVTEALVRVQLDDYRRTVVFDPLARVAFFKVNTGDPPTMDTPAPGVAVALLAVVAVAVAGATRPGRPRG